MFEPSRHSSVAHHLAVPCVAALSAGAALAVAALVAATSAVAVAPAVGLLLWACVYAGAVFEPPLARLYAAGLCLGPAAVVVLASGVAHGGGIAIALGATVGAIVEFLSRTCSGLRREAVTDPLTGLRNRNGFLEASERAISICRRAGWSLAVAHIDIDGFKAINDRDGHLEGDHVLRECAEAWRSEVRAGDVLARLGGDEFALVLVGDDRVAAVALLERLRARSPVGWSYGIAELGPGDDVEACLARADVELYAAKAERARAGGQDAAGPAPPRRPGLSGDIAARCTGSPRGCRNQAWRLSGSARTALREARRRPYQR